MPPISNDYRSILDPEPPIGTCYPELPFMRGDRDGFGYNWTHPDAPPAQPWGFFTPEELGGRPTGVKSASLAALSRQPYETGGFVAVVIPFFSEEWLPEQEGPVDDLIDHRIWAVNTTNTNRPRWWCVRLSHNGRHFRQLCDPTTETIDGTGELTGVVRAAVERMWNDMKRGHFIDAKTRLVTVTLQLRSNHLGVRHRTTLMFELTSLGAVLPSFEVETRLISYQLSGDMNWYAQLSLYMVCMFAVLEGLQLLRGLMEKGLAFVPEYLTDLWNVMDWLNFGCFALAYMQVDAVIKLLNAGEGGNVRVCEVGNIFCSDVGYFDDWRLMSEYRLAKQYLALNLSLQMLKTIKFISALVPKFSLFVDVLRYALVDLLFFSVIYALTVAAFSLMLYIQLGPTMVEFYDYYSGFVTLARAIFFDFDLDVVTANSDGSYLNLGLYLAYLFVAIFVMLTLLISLLAEAKFRISVVYAKEKEDDPSFSEFGFLGESWRNFMKVYRQFLKWLDKLLTWGVEVDDDDDESKKYVEEVVPAEVTQLAEIELVRDEVRDLREAMGELFDGLKALRRGDEKAQQDAEQQAAASSAAAEGDQQEMRVDDEGAARHDGPPANGGDADAPTADGTSAAWTAEGGAPAPAPSDDTVGVGTAEDSAAEGEGTAATGTAASTADPDAPSTSTSVVLTPVVAEHLEPGEWVEPMRRAVSQATSDAAERASKTAEARTAKATAKASHKRALKAEVGEVRRMLEALGDKYGTLIAEIDRSLEGTEHGGAYRNAEQRAAEAALEAATAERLAEQEERRRRRAELGSEGGSDADPDGWHGDAWWEGDDGKLTDGSPVTRHPGKGFHGFNDLVLDSTVNNQSLSECFSYPQYNITLKDEIAATYKLMRETTSAGMLAFYQHNLLAKFKDAHTFASTSAMPKATFPIGVEPVFVDGEMKFQYDNGKRFVSTPFMEANPEFIKTVQTAPPGVSVYITAVNGQPPLQYFKKVADTMGVSKDQSVRLNMFFAGGCKMGGTYNRLVPPDVPEGEAGFADEGKLTIELEVEGKPVAPINFHWKYDVDLNGWSSDFDDMLLKFVSVKTADAFATTWAEVFSHGDSDGDDACVKRIRKLNDDLKIDQLKIAAQSDKDVATPPTELKEVPAGQVLLAATESTTEKTVREKSASKQEFHPPPCDFVWKGHATMDTTTDPSESFGIRTMCNSTILGPGGEDAGTYSVYVVVNDKGEKSTVVNTGGGYHGMGTWRSICTNPEKERIFTWEELLPGFSAPSTVVKNTSSAWSPDDAPACPSACPNSCFQWTVSIIDVLTAAVNIARDWSDGKLTIDVMSNGGGDISEGYWMNDFLYRGMADAPTFAQPIDSCEFYDYPEGELLSYLRDVSTKRGKYLDLRSVRDPKAWIEKYIARVDTLSAELDKPDSVFADDRFRRNKRKWTTRYTSLQGCFRELLAPYPTTFPAKGTEQFETLAAQYDYCFDAEDSNYVDPMSVVARNAPSNLKPAGITPYQAADAGSKTLWSKPSWEHWEQKVYKKRAGPSGSRTFTAKHTFAGACNPYEWKAMVGSQGATDFQERFLENYRPQTELKEIFYLTTGFCGSTCSVTTSRPYLDGLSTVIPVGGVYENGKWQPMDITSFNGGNVFGGADEMWLDILFALLLIYADFPKIAAGSASLTLPGWAHIPTPPIINGGERFAQRSQYPEALGDNALPREWYKVASVVTEHIPVWGIAPSSANVDINRLTAYKMAAGAKAQRLPACGVRHAKEYLDRKQAQVEEQFGSNK